MCQTLSLSFPHPHLPPSLLHILSLSSFHVSIHQKHQGKHPSEGGTSMSQHPSPQQPYTEPSHRQCLHLSYLRTCSHQSTGVVCGGFVWMGEEVFFEKKYLGMKNSMKIIFLSRQKMSWLIVWVGCNYSMKTLGKLFISCIFLHDSEGQEAFLHHEHE